MYNLHFITHTLKQLFLRFLTIFRCKSKSTVWQAKNTTIIRCKAVKV
jgi:hypothetical protein